MYVQSAAGEWQKATVIAALGGGRYRVQLEPWEDELAAGGKSARGNGETLEVDASKMEGGSLPFQNADMPKNGFSDMTALDHLHEAALLHNLRARFFADACPYTYTADIIIAVNPYRWFPQLYTEEQRKEYLVFDRAKLPPHAYAASSAAYAGLRESKKDQAILVSGESGAGKTETVKILMRHLALIASSDDSSHIKRIVESNPLLESFGNAQTVRNDNSSRFGKFIELQLNGNCNLVGSKCRTYLLEKSRVVSQDSGERSYHIFYQMLGASPEQRSSFGLGNTEHTRDTMRYTRLGASQTYKIEGKTDGEMLQVTIDALALVGVEGELLGNLLRALAGVLLIGQIDFDGGSGMEAVASIAHSCTAAAAEAAAALQVDVKPLEEALTRQVLKMRNESVVKPLTPVGAAANRDALAKELYSRLFDWLVAQICAATTAPEQEAKHFVGLLDIFGFESFAINRFEQLCINYANEKLQQKFTLDVFKAVQQEYADEGIPWDRIEFKDNAPLLALVESKMGIISMLNEECVRPKGSEENFVSKLTTVHKEDHAFSRPKLGAKKEIQFSIRHYAGHVTYTTSGWLERNKDSISDDIVSLLLASSNPMITGIFSKSCEMTQAAEEGPSKARKGADTVVTKFKNSLAQLMDTIGRTQTQYVRCIKPNKKKSPCEMDNSMVVEQLRCAGVIEAIRISRAGFPARMPLVEFMQRFGVLARAVAGVGFASGTAAVRSSGVSDPKLAASAVASLTSGADKAAACKALSAALVGEKQQYEVGRTRVYFKSGALESLEERRALLLQAAATELVRQIKGHRCRQLYQFKKRAALKIQSAERMRGQRAAFAAKRAATVVFQSARRAMLARRLAAAMREDRCATRIQAHFHRWRATKRLKHSRQAAVRLQAAARRRNCMKQYRLDLAEFKEQAKLENQVKALQAKLTAAQEQAKLAAVQQQVVVQSSETPEEIVQALKALTTENEKLRGENERQKADIIALRKENQQLRADLASRSEVLQATKRSHKQATTDEPQRNSSLSSTVTAPSSKQGTALTFASQISAEGDADGGAGKVRGGFVHYPPLNSFWDDLPFHILPHLQSGIEVHIKCGKLIFNVDAKNQSIVVTEWMDCGIGYYRSMAFFIERSITSGDPRSPGAGDDTGAVGGEFVLRSALTGKYLQVQSAGFRANSIKVTATKPEDAARFTFLENIIPEDAMEVCPGASTNPAEHIGMLKLHNENKILKVKSDLKTIAVSALSDMSDPHRRDRLAVSFEYLLPRTEYEITVEERPIGINISKELPIRVMGFKATQTQFGKDIVGPAERTGRVNIGDILQTVNGQDIAGIPCEEVEQMIGCKLPLDLQFQVVRDTGGTVTPVPSEPQKQDAPASKRQSILSSFSVRGMLNTKSKTTATPNKNQAAIKPEVVEL